MRPRAGGIGRRVVLAASLGAMALASGCFRKSKRPVPEQEPVTLHIVSHAFADMDVYVMPSTAGGAMRLTTVTGFAKADVRIRTTQMQPGIVLQLELHAIGSTSRWQTNAVPMSPGEHAVLEINSDAYGGLSRSVLYPIPDPDGGDSAGARPR